MEKVKVSEEIIDGFESCKNCINLGYFKDNKWDLDFMLMQKIKSNFEEERSVLNQLSTEYFFDCIRFGYELEDTKEEKLLKLYITNHKNVNCVRSYRCGIYDTLNILFEKIEGINK